MSETRERLPAPEHVNPLIKSILDDFKGITHRQNESAKSFICHYDLERIWTEERVRGLLSAGDPGNLPGDLLPVIQQKMFTILSVLVTIGAFSCQINFLARLFTPNRRPRLTDEDLPLRELEKIDFLDGWDAFKEQFFYMQHKFRPVEIRLGAQQKHEEIDPSRRLPFKTLIPCLGSGAFGDVELIGIPGQYFIKEDGSQFPGLYKVACKKLRVDKDFSNEADTLQILKESLVSQRHILKHLATIKHGPDRYILLPYASHGDLFQFLHCGMPLDDELSPYNFDEKFPSISNTTTKIARPLLRQCWALANAVDWLHGGITIESNSSSSKVFCIHMDLKPDNILIQPDSDSIVGKWMISDFGISVTKEKEKKENPNILSIRDWYNRFTSVNTRPRRNAGTYQAPEVKSAENLRNQPTNLSHDQRGVGSKSDIWSCGCIFSEILAFAIGRAEEVKKFNFRRRNGQNDYFFDYEFLGGKAQVRQSVIDWLNSIRNSSSSANKWEGCWAETIKKILVIDPKDRPNAAKLQSFIAHVKHHVSMDPQEAKNQCDILSTLEPQNPDNRGFLPQTHDAPEVPQNQPNFLTTTSSLSLNRTAHSQVVHRPSVDLDKGPEITVSPPQDEDPPEHEEPISPIQLMPPHYESINARRKQGKQAYWPSQEGVAIDVALSHYDKKTRAAFLTREAVRIFDLNLETLDVTTPGKRYTISDPLENARITLSGRFIAVWGFCQQQKKKMFYFRDIEKEGDDLGNAISEDLGLLRSVAISPQGIVALVRRDDILIKKAQSIESNRSSGTPLKLYPDNEQIFAHAAFNDVGKLLFAWAYGTKGESLRVWKVDSSLSKHSVARYPSEEREALHTKVIPYNTGMGCVVAAPEQRVFPVQTQKQTQKKIDDKTRQLRRRDFEIKNIETGCVFQDYSFVALRKKGFWPRQKWFLREYQIEHQDTTDFLHKGPELCDLISKPEASSQLRILRVSENPESKVVAIICNRDSIELVPFVPK